MDEQKQQKFRENAIEVNTESAWRCLAKYSYFGKKYQSLETQITEYLQRIKNFEDEIKKIGSLPDYHTTENKKKVKGFRKDIDSYKTRLKGIEPIAKQLFETSIKWREEGMQFLEMAEECKTFRMNTKEEIEQQTEQERVKEA